MQGRMTREGAKGGGKKERRKGGREEGKEGRRERERQREKTEREETKNDAAAGGGGGGGSEGARQRARGQGRERQVERDRGSESKREREGRREVHTRATKSPSNGKCEAARNKVGKRSKKRGRESYAKHRNRRGTTNALRYCQRWRERDQEQPGIREVLGGSRSELISAGIMGTAGGE